MIPSPAGPSTCDDDGQMTHAGGVTTLPVLDLRADPDQLRNGLLKAAHEVGFSI
uniref:Uncharacterized protein n=1 Tax=Mycobacterium riyadhense TaxID=486698 RepID=A0A653ECW0_9MYCO|nr:hypothetical protein BIN_B_00837 [Mycobacterium riyadhense]